MRYGALVVLSLLLVTGGLVAVEYLAPRSNPVFTGGVWIVDAYVFSNTTGSYVAVTLGVGKPVYVRFIAVSQYEWMAGPIPQGSEQKYVEMAESEAVVPVNMELEPGVHALVYRLPESPKLLICSMNYPVWTNSKGVRLVSLYDKAYPLDEIGVLRLYEKPVVRHASGYVMNIYVYKLGGNVPWTVQPGIDLKPFEEELVSLLARGASEEELSEWARRVATAIYESLLNGTSKAYITPTWEVDRSAIERLYRAGVLSLVFDFQAHYIEEKGVVETRGDVSRYYANLSYVRGAYIRGRYDHLYTGLRIESRGEEEYIDFPTDVLCDQVYAVLVVYGETPYTKAEVLGATAPNKSLLEYILEKRERIK